MKAIKENKNINTSYTCLILNTKSTRKEIKQFSMRKKNKKIKYVDKKP